MLPDPDESRMPPVGVKERLTPDQVAKLKAWIEQGAEYPPHWAFVVPKRPAVPEIRNPKSEIRNPIDAFIFARLETGRSDAFIRRPTRPPSFAASRST